MSWMPFAIESPPASPRMMRGLRLVAWLAAGLVVAIGASTASLVLLLSGLSLGLSIVGPGPGHSPTRLRWPASVLAIASASVAVATMPPVLTSVAVILADAAIVMLDVHAQRGPTPSELLALTAGTMGWLALGSHPNEALGLMALALGIATSRPAAGATATLASVNLGGQAARRMLPFALAVPLLGYFAAWAQRARLYGSPEAAIVEGAAGMVAAVAIALTVGRSLDRTDAEHRLLAQENREWKRFFDRATFGAVLGTPDGRLGRVNEAFARMHGYTVPELEGRPVSDVFPPERRAELEAKMQVVEQRGHCRWESEHFRKDGSVFPVFVDITAVRDDAGTLLYRAAYIQDIGEQKEAEAARARLASLVESSDDVIIAEALDGTVLDWNQGAERVFGFSAREMVGHSICPIVPRELRQERCALRAHALAGETVVGFETERMRKDGQRIPIALTLSPIRDPVGRVVGISTIERDISTLKRLEREREEWAAVVAHDLRQPAATIHLATDWLAQSETNPSRQRVIERIRKASDRLERMIGDLLDVSRIESRRLAVHAEPVDLRPLIAEVVALQHGVDGRCRVDVDPDAARAQVDAERFVQVLSNLLSNASKYGEPGTPVEVCVEPIEGMIRVTVTNEGPGISPEDIPRLFSRFARTRAAQGGTVPGLGLGLYICRGIVEAHGGRLWVESVPGDQTHFRFTLPRAPRDESKISRTGPACT